MAAAEKYEGDYKDGKRHGKGTMTFADGHIYEGDFQDDKRHGKGTMTLANGRIYEGDFQDDKMHGKGTMTGADGHIYEGDYKDDKRHGKGTYTWANGDIYEGDYQDGKMNGTVTFTFASGGVYEGDYQDDQVYSGGRLIQTNASHDNTNKDDSNVEGKEITTKKSTRIIDLPDDMFRLIREFHPINELYQVSNFFHAMKGRLYHYKFTKKHSLEYHVSKAFREHVQGRISNISRQLSLDLSYCSGITDVSVLRGVHTLNLSCCSNVTNVTILRDVKVLKRP